MQSYNEDNGAAHSVVQCSVVRPWSCYEVPLYHAHNLILDVCKLTVTRRLIIWADVMQFGFYISFLWLTAGITEFWL